MLKIFLLFSTSSKSYSLLVFSTCFYITIFFSLAPSSSSSFQRFFCFSTLPLLLALLLHFYRCFCFIFVYSCVCKIGLFLFISFNFVFFLPSYYFPRSKSLFFSLVLLLLSYYSRVTSHGFVYFVQVRNGFFPCHLICLLFILVYLMRVRIQGPHWRVPMGGWPNQDANLFRFDSFRFVENGGHQMTNAKKSPADKCYTWCAWRKGLAPMSEIWFSIQEDDICMEICE